MKNVLPAPRFSITNYTPSLSPQFFCESLAFVDPCFVMCCMVLGTLLCLCVEKIDFSIYPEVTTVVTYWGGGSSPRLFFFGLEISNEKCKRALCQQITMRYVRRYTSLMRFFTQFGLCVEKMFGFAPSHWLPPRCR